MSSVKRLTNCSSRFYTGQPEPDYHILQLSAAAEVSRATGGILDPDELIYQVVEMTRERFGLYYVGLFLVEREKTTRMEPKWAVLRAGTGEAGRKMVADAIKSRWMAIRMSAGVLLTNLRIIEDTERIGKRKKTRCCRKPVQGWRCR